jgi:hypothetical protein
MPTGAIARPPSVITVMVGATPMQASMDTVILASQGLETIRLKKDESFSVKYSSFSQCGTMFTVLRLCIPTFLLLQPSMLPMIPDTKSRLSCG